VAPSYGTALGGAGAGRPPGASAKEGGCAGPANPASVTPPGI